MMNRHKILMTVALASHMALFSCANHAEDSKQDATTEVTPTALVTFDVQGMTCAGCEANVKLALRNVAGVKKVEASYEAAEAKISVNPDKVKEQEIAAALDKIGYKAKKKGS